MSKIELQGLSTADRVYCSLSLSLSPSSSSSPSSTHIEASWSGFGILSLNIIAIRSRSRSLLSPTTVPVSCSLHSLRSLYTEEIALLNSGRYRCQPTHRRQAASLPLWLLRNHPLPNPVRRCTGDRDQVRIAPNLDCAHRGPRLTFLSRLFHLSIAEEEV